MSAAAIDKVEASPHATAQPHTHDHENLGHNAPDPTPPPAPPPAISCPSVPPSFPSFAPLTPPCPRRSSAGRPRSCLCASKRRLMGVGARAAMSSWRSASCSRCCSIIVWWRAGRRVSGIVARRGSCVARSRGGLGGMSVREMGTGEDGTKADGNRCRDRRGEFMVETTAWEGGR